MHITFEFEITEYWDQYIWIPFKKANKNIRNDACLFNL